MVRGVLHNSLNFLLIAKSAADRIQAPNPFEPNKADALISIAFASSALEAFINERTEMAAVMCGSFPQAEVVRAFSQVLRDAENSRLSVPAKYQMAHWILFGTAYEQGKNPYQDFSLLIDVRNSLLHLKPRPSIMRDLETKKVLAEHSSALENVSGGWTYRVSTKEMADWAVAAAVRFLKDLLESGSSDVVLHTLLPKPKDFFGATWAQFAKSI